MDIIIKKTILLNFARLNVRIIGLFRSDSKRLILIRFLTTMIELSAAQLGEGSVRIPLRVFVRADQRGGA